MNRSKASRDKKAPQSPVTRMTRGSSSQARPTDPAEAQDDGPGPHAKQRRKQTHSALAQDLSQMSVSRLDCLPTR